MKRRRSTSFYISHHNSSNPGIVSMWVSKSFSSSFSAAAKNLLNRRKSARERARGKKRLSQLTTTRVEVKMIFVDISRFAGYFCASPARVRDSLKVRKHLPRRKLRAEFDHEAKRSRGGIEFLPTDGHTRQNSILIDTGRKWS